MRKVANVVLALLIVVLICSTAVFASDSVQTSIPGIYRVAVSKWGTMRILSPDNKGKYGNAPTKWESVIELASLESIDYLQEMFQEIQDDVANTIDGLAALEEIVNNLPYESIDERLTLIEELIDSLSTIDLEESVADLLDRMLLLEELVDSVPISVLEESIANIANRLALLEGIVDELPDAGLEDSIDALAYRLALLEDIVDNLSSGEPPADPPPVFDLAGYIGESPPSDNGNHTNVNWDQLASGLWTMNFNGVSNSVSSFDTLDDTTDFTITFWIRANSGEDGVVISTYDGSSPYWHSRFHPAYNDKLRFFGNDSSSDAVWTSMANVTDGAWHNCTIKVDIDDDVFIYVDGVEGTTRVVRDITSIDGNLHDGGAMLIGSHATGGAYLNANLALFKIYDYALSEQQISDQYDETRVLFGL